MPIKPQVISYILAMANLKLKTVSFLSQTSNHNTTQTMHNIFSFTLPLKMMTLVISQQIPRFTDPIHR